MNMAFKDVIITCSGLGTRLKPITEYLNKALVKVGDQAILSYIFNEYPEDCRFIITVGYLKEQIIDYVRINHSNLNVVFVDVDDYSGPKSSLLYSLSKTFDLIDKPFIYNACDTYIPYMEGITQNTAIVSQTFIDNQYRKISHTIEDVPAKQGEFCYTGACYIKDFDDFKKIALKLLENPNTNQSDAHVLKCLDIKFKNIENWIDVGNFIALENARENCKYKICVLEKYGQETYCVNGKIVKFFHNKDKVNLLYERYEELKDCVPKCNKLGNFIYYDFVKGKTLSKILDKELLKTFLNWCENNLWIYSNIKQDNFFEDFYLKKALNRIEMFESKYNIDINDQTINFRHTQNLKELLESIPDKFKHNTRLCRIHGDLVFENVIKTVQDFVLIDWREGFITNIGDMFYDIAKMKHNLIFDHEIIKNKKFYVKIEKNQIFLDPGTPKKNIELIGVLNNWCLEKNIDLDQIDMIVSLIQLSSSGLHIENEAKLLYYMGWAGLNKIINE